MNFELVCRICLSESNLIPIFVGGCNPIASESIFITTGLEVNCNDSLPQNICSVCTQTILEIIDFRAKCSAVEKQLLSILKDRQQSENDMTQVKSEHSNCELNKFMANDDDDEVLSSPISNDDEIEEDNKPLNLWSSVSSKENIENPLFNIHHEKNENTKLASEKKRKNCKNPKFKKKKLITDSEIKSLISNNFTQLEGLSDSGKLICKLCSKNVYTNKIIRHISKEHPEVDVRKTECQLCHQFVLIEQMPKHNSIVHSKIKYMSREMVECDECNKKMLRASLKQHKRVQHAGIRPTCEHCGQKFGNKLRLTEHYRAKHGYEKLRCTVCDFASSSESALKNHERLHRGEKPYVCEICGSKFHAAYLLSQHRQSHRTEKAVKCTVCEATFKANNTLHTHMRTCHSESSYRCGICKKSFAALVYARRHCRGVHGSIGMIETIPKLPEMNES